HPAGRAGVAGGARGRAGCAAPADRRCELSRRWLPEGARRASGLRLVAVAEHATTDSQITAEAAAPRPVLVVDFGAQYAQLTARRVREARIYSEVIPHTATVEEIRAKDPVALILSGGPASVYADDAPRLD